MPITVLHNQTILDISIRYYGTAEAAFLIANLNQLSVTDELEPGMILQLPNVDFGSSEIVEYFRVNKKQPATSFEAVIETYNYEFPCEFAISF